MKQNSTNEFSQERGKGRLLTHLWKRLALAATAVIMVIGIAGCALDDLTSGAGGDVPFEQEQTTPREMDVLDNVPTVPDDAAFDDFDSRPLSPLN